MQTPSNTVAGSSLQDHCSLVGAGDVGSSEV